MDAEIHTGYMPQYDKVNKRSISRNILLSTALVCLILIVVIGSTFYHVTKQELINSYDKLLYNKAIDSSKLADEQIKNYVVSIETLGGLSIITDNQIPIEEKLEFLTKEKTRLNLTHIGISDLQGNLILDTGETMDIYEEEYFYETMSGNSYFSQPMINPLTGKISIVISTPIMSSENLSGVLVAYTSADKFYNITQDIQFGESGYSFIINHRADVIAHPTIRTGATAIDDTKNFETLINLVDPEYVEDMIKVQEMISSNESGTGKYSRDGKIVRIGFAPIKSKNWTLVVSISEEEILSGLNWLLRTLLIVVAAASILGYLASSFFIKRITNRISILTEHSHRISNMDFTENIDDDILSREDEIGIIGNSLQTIIEHIRNMFHNLSLTAAQVAASSQQLAAISEETAASANNIHEASTKISESTRNQHNEILNAINSIREISVQMGNVSEKAKDANSLSVEISGKAKSGRERINESIIQMDNIKNSTLTVKKSLEEVMQSFSKMNQMLNIIENISEQTNLLALNAAIEAARAGEHGLGFGVVANEIKKLSEETQKSAKEVKSIIAGNNILINETNNKMDSNTYEVEQGVIAVKEAKTSFDEITSLIEDIAMRIEHIANSTVTVENNVNNLVKSSDIIEEMSQNISMEIMNSSTATEEQLASTEEIASSAENLANLAEEVRSLLDSIKVEKN